jgi:hypothetical protein
MAVTTGTAMSFNFCTLDQFKAYITAETLKPGGLYFVDGVLYVATSVTEYQDYGKIRNVVSLPAAVDAEEGMIYFMPTTRLLAVSDGTAWKYLNNGFVSLRYDDTTELTYLVRQDGTEEVLELSSDVISVGTGDADELITADATGKLERSGLKAVSVIDDTVANTDADKQVPLEQAVIDYVAAKVGTIAGGLRFKGNLPATLAAIDPAPETGWFYRVATAGTFESTEVAVGDWVIFTSASAFIVAEGVENAAVASLDSTSDVLPLAASQGKELKEMIEEVESDLDDKLDVLTVGDPNLFVTTAGDGQVKDSGLSKTSALDTATPSADKIPDEVAVAGAIGSAVSSLDSKLNTAVSTLEQKIEDDIEDAIESLFVWNVG